MSAAPYTDLPPGFTLVDSPPSNGRKYTDLPPGFTPVDQPNDLQPQQNQGYTDLPPGFTLEPRDPISTPLSWMSDVAGLMAANGSNQPTPPTKPAPIRFGALNESPSDPNIIPQGRLPVVGMPATQDPTQLPKDRLTITGKGVLDEVKDAVRLARQTFPHLGDPYAPDVRVDRPPGERGFIEGVVAGVSRAENQIVKSAAGLAEMGAVAANEMLPATNRIDDMDSAWFIRGLRDIQRDAESYNRKNAPSASVSGASLTKDPWGTVGNPKWWAENLAEQVPQIALQLAAAMVAGPEAPAAMRLAAFATPTFVQEGGSAYMEARDRLQQSGAPRREATALAIGEGLLVGTVNAALDTIPGAVYLLRGQPAQRIFRESLLQRLRQVGERSAAGRMGLGAQAEGVTEIVQEAVKDVVRYVAENDPAAFTDWQNRYGQVGLIAAAAGGGTDVALGEKGLQGSTPPSPPAAPAVPTPPPAPAAPTPAPQPTPAAPLPAKGDAETGKQAWEMTRSEYKQSKAVSERDFKAGQWANMHINGVASAAAAGKIDWESDLGKQHAQDYPDLAAKYGKPAAPQPATPAKDSPQTPTPGESAAETRINLKGAQKAKATQLRATRKALSKRLARLNAKPDTTERAQAIAALGRKIKAVDDQLDAIYRRAANPRVMMPKGWGRDALAAKLIAWAKSQDMFESGWDAETGGRMVDVNEDNGSDGSMMFTFNDKLPQEVIEHFDGRPPKALRVVKPGDRDYGSGMGEDYMVRMGDAYFAELDRIASGDAGRLRKALDEARDHPDPEVRLWAYLYENTPMADSRVRAQTVKTDSLEVGDAVKIQGEHFDVTTDENGSKVLKDGVTLEVEGLKEVPIDKGSHDTSDRGKNPDVERAKSMTQEEWDALAESDPDEFERLSTMADNAGVEPSLPEGEFAPPMETPQPSAPLTGAQPTLTGETPTTFGDTGQLFAPSRKPSANAITEADAAAIRAENAKREAAEREKQQPGETDEEYRIRRKWTKPGVAAGTGNVFEGATADKAAESTPPDTSGLYRLDKDAAGATTDELLRLQTAFEGERNRRRKRRFDRSVTAAKLRAVNAELSRRRASDAAKLSDEEWLQQTRFFRSGQSRTAELPDGRKVILRNENTASNFRELSREFLLFARNKPSKRTDTTLPGGFVPLPQDVIERAMTNAATWTAEHARSAAAWIGDKLGTFAARAGQVRRALVDLFGDKAKRFFGPIWRSFRAMARDEEGAFKPVDMATKAANAIGRLTKRKSIGPVVADGTIAEPTNPYILASIAANMVEEAGGTDIKAIRAAVDAVLAQNPAGNPSRGVLIDGAAEILRVRKISETTDIDPEFAEQSRALGRAPVVQATPKSQRKVVKQIIREATERKLSREQAPPTVKRALRRRMSRPARIAAMREQIALLQFKAGIKGAPLAQLQKMAISLVESLPTKWRAELTAKANSAATSGDIPKLFDKVAAALDRAEKSALIKRIRKVLGKSKTLRRRFFEKTNEAVAGIDVKNRQSSFWSRVAKTAEYLESDKARARFTAISLQPAVLREVQKVADKMRTAGRDAATEQDIPRALKTLTNAELRNVLNTLEHYAHLNALHNKLVAQGNARKLSETVKTVLSEADQLEPNELDETQASRNLIDRGKNYQSMPGVRAERAGQTYYRVVHEVPRAAYDKSVGLYNRTKAKLDKIAKEHGFTDSRMIEIRNAAEKVDMLGKSVPLTRSQRMHLRAMLEREESARKVVGNGLLPDQWRGQAKRRVVDPESQERTYNEFDRAATLTADEQAVFDAYVAELRQLAEQARPVIEALFGRDVFSEIDYILRMIVDLSNKPKNLSPVDNVQAIMQAWLENNGSLKDPVAHKNPLLIVDFFGEADRQLKFLSDMIHLAPAVRDALKVVGHPDIQQKLAKKFGTNFQRDVVRTLAKASGTYHHEPLSGAEKITEWSGRNIAVNRLAGKISPIFNNHVNGLISYAALMPPAEAARFAARVVAEQRRPLDPEAVLAIMENDGMFNRWAGSSQRLVRPAYYSKDVNMPHRKITMWYRKLQEAFLAPMKWMEMRNAAILYRHQLAEGLSRVDAAAKVDLMTRDSQNPVTPFEESPFVDSVKRNPFMAISFMFSGQPSVSHNILLRLGSQARAAGRRGDKAEQRRLLRQMTWAAGGLATNAAVTVAFRNALRAVKYVGVPSAVAALLSGKWKEDDDEEERMKNAVVDAASELMNTAVPGTGMLAQNFLAPVMVEDPYALQSTAGAVWTNLFRGWKHGVALGKEGFDPDHAIAAGTELMRGFGAIFGLPTEGVKEAAELAGVMPKPDFTERHRAAKQFGKHGGEAGGRIEAYIDRFYEEKPDSRVGLGLPSKSFTAWNGEHYEFTDAEYDQIIKQAFAGAASSLSKTDLSKISDEKMEYIRTMLRSRVKDAKDKITSKLKNSDLAARKKK